MIQPAMHAPPSTKRYRPVLIGLSSASACLPACSGPVKTPYLPEASCLLRRTNRASHCVFAAELCNKHKELKGISTREHFAQQGSRDAMRERGTTCPGSPVPSSSMLFFFRAKSPTQTFLLADGRGTFRCAVIVNGVACNVPSGKSERCGNV